MKASQFTGFAPLKVARKVQKLHLFSLVAIYTPSAVFKDLF
jgi:hypothetical protein